MLQDLQLPITKELGWGGSTCLVQGELHVVRACAHSSWKCPPPRPFWDLFILVWVGALGIGAGAKAGAVIYGAYSTLPCLCSPSYCPWTHPQLGGLEKTSLSSLWPDRHCIFWDRCARMDGESQVQLQVRMDLFLCELPQA